MADTDNMFSGIQLIDAGELRTGRGGKRGTGAKYAKYGVAVEPHVEFLKQAIDKAKADKDGIKRIRVLNEEMAKNLGPEFAGKNATSIYWGLKFQLFGRGIVVDTATHSTGKKALVFRVRTEKDILPPSLAKHLTGEAAGVEGDEEMTEEEKKEAEGAEEQ